MYVDHTEYIGDVISSSSASTYANAVIGQSNSTYPQLQLNPGNQIAFPWLSIIAGDFLEYEFEDLVFEYLSTSSSALNSTNTALGLIATRYELNPVIGVDNSMTTLLNTHGHHKDKTYNSFTIRVPCDGKRKYVRFSQGTQTNNWGLATNQDIRMYDQGWVNIATTGVQATSVNLGQIHVHYKVKFYRPYYNIIGNPTLIGSSAYYAAGAGNTAAAPLNGMVNTNLTNNSSMPLTFTGNTTFVFPAALTYGYFLISFWVLGGAQNLGATTNPVVTNGTLITGMLNQTQQVSYSASPNVALQTQLGATFIVLVTNSNCTVNITNLYAQFPSPSTNATLNVAQISGAMVNYRTT